MVYIWFSNIRNNDNISLHNFLFNVIQNEDMVIPATIIMGVVGFILFVRAIKKYLKENSELILNMKEDEEGRKEKKGKNIY